ncbi:hypothetical protein J4403_03130 [Candidatus Woesearchaeota archaeon]|nr:hypothetical protein [Candidatus Woesearchaeota archaeon]
MDVLAHFLWINALFYKRKKAWLAGLFGILPDVVAFGPMLILYFFIDGVKFGKPDYIPGFVQALYNLSHSLVIFLGVIFGIYFLTKKFYWYLTGWGLHILMDIPTHARDFFPTHFLYPLSDVTFNGYSWGQKDFMVVNWLLLAVVYLMLLIRVRRKKIK